MHFAARLTLLCGILLLCAGVSMGDNKLERESAQEGGGTGLKACAACGSAQPRESYSKLASSSPLLPTHQSLFEPVKCLFSHRAGVVLAPEFSPSSLPSDMFPCRHLQKPLSLKLSSCLSWRRPALPLQQFLRLAHQHSSTLGDLDVVQCIRSDPRPRDSNQQAVDGQGSQQEVQHMRTE